MKTLPDTKSAFAENPTFHASEQQDGALRARTGMGEKPQNILHVVSHIEANLWSPLDLDDLARTAQLSKFHFCRTFKRHIGMNPMKFVASLRIEEAKKLMSRKDLTVSAIAEEVGYRDLSNFIRQFKKNTGMTPTTYREAAKSQCHAVYGSESEAVQL